MKINVRSLVTIFLLIHYSYIHIVARDSALNNIQKNITKVPNALSFNSTVALLLQFFPKVNTFAVDQWILQKNGDTLLTYTPVSILFTTLDSAVLTYLSDAFIIAYWLDSKQIALDNDYKEMIKRIFIAETAHDHSNALKNLQDVIALNASYFKKLYPFGNASDAEDANNVKQVLKKLKNEYQIKENSMYIDALKAKEMKNKGYGYVHTITQSRGDLKSF